MAAAQAQTRCFLGEGQGDAGQHRGRQKQGQPQPMPHEHHGPIPARPHGLDEVVLCKPIHPIVKLRAQQYFSEYEWHINYGCKLKGPQEGIGIFSGPKQRSSEHKWNQVTIHIADTNREGLPVGQAWQVGDAVAEGFGVGA